MSASARNQTWAGCRANKKTHDLDVHVDTMSTLPPASISDESSDSDSPSCPRWADIEFEEEDATGRSACSAISSEDLPPHHAKRGVPVSASLDGAPQNCAMPMQAWQWVPVTMVPVASPAPPAAVPSHHFQFAQNGSGMFDFKQALEARKKAMGHMVNELAAASRKIENEAAIAEHSCKAMSTQSKGAGGRDRTTIMIRNIPSGCTRAMIQATIDWEGFAGQYDFLYLPCSFDDWSALGHAFINFPVHRNAERAIDKLNGGIFWPEIDCKPCEVCWSKALQGLAACVGRFRNSPVMDTSVSDAYKPILLKKGVRSTFPEPTKKIQPVRRRGEGN